MKVLMHPWGRLPRAKPLDKLGAVSWSPFDPAQGDPEAVGVSNGAMEIPASSG